jgi:protein involved in polysaccharide export with SLBB domain
MKHMLGRAVSKLFAIVIIVLYVGTGIGSAQDLDSMNFQRLRSSDLSDQQVKQYWERAQDRGLSLNDLEKMALARGMNPSEVTKLSRRIQTLRLTEGNRQTQQIEDGRMRSANSVDDTDKPAKTSRDSGSAKVFGSSLFQSRNLSFAPSLNIPTPVDYELAAGDEIIVDIWGAAEQTYRLKISPEGTVNIENLGPIYLNGSSIDEARQRLFQEFSKIYSGLNPKDSTKKNTYFRLTLGDIRSIKVTVLGEVSNPGTYTVSSLATVFNALYLAGGPSRNGTYRDIQVYRGGKKVATLDVYDFLVDGDQQGNIRLNDQDMIKIDTYDNHVRLKGETKRVGIFELKERETLEDLLMYAGGFSDQAYTKRIKIRGNTETERRITDVRYPEERYHRLRNGDEVTVGRILDRFANRVEIQGAVFREGEYELNDTTTVYSLIQRAEGLRGDAYQKRALIYRTREDYTVEAIPFDLGALMEDPGQHDIVLSKDDVVRIASLFDLREEYTVTLKGAVQNAGQIPFVDHLTLEDAIFQANGFKEAAAPYRIEVARRIVNQDSAVIPDKMTEWYRFDIDPDLELGPSAASFELQPFDYIYVRSSPGYVEQEEVSVNGEVLFPGTYALQSKRMRISDLVDAAGGLSQYAYAQGARLERLSQTRNHADNLNVEDSLSLKKQLDRRKVDVGIDLPAIMANRGSEIDLILRRGDRLVIPRRLQTVEIAGEVLYPVSVRFESQLSMRDYIRKAGGVTEDGMKRKAYIVYANGEVDRSSWFLFFRKYPKVRPGATIFIPREKQKRELTTQERIGILSSIVSMAAIVSTTIFQVTR